MAGRVIPVARIAGLLVLGGSILAMLAGGAMIAASLGKTGLAGLGVYSGIAIMAIGAAMLVPGVLLRRAASTLRVGGPDRPDVSPGRRRGSTVVAALVSLIWLAATVSNIVAFGFSLMALLGVAVAFVFGIAAWTGRYFPDRPLGAALVAVSILSAVPAAWLAFSWVEQAAEQAAESANAADDRRQYEERYAPIRQGPSAGDIAAAVGQVGSWRPITGRVFPELNDDDWAYAPKDALAELRGQRVRFAVVGQCWADGPGGQVGVRGFLTRPDASGDVAERLEFALPVFVCDGQVHAASSELISLPEWFNQASPPGERKDWLSASHDVTLASGTAGASSPEHATRWVMFVSPDPPSSLDDLRSGVAGQVEPLLLQ